MIKQFLEVISAARNINILNLLSCVICLASVFLIIKYYPVGVDSAFYLSVSKSIAKGLVPYKDIQMFYVPLPFYFLSIPYHISMETSYEVMLGVMVVVKMAGTYVMYRIGRLLFDNRKIVLFVSLNFFMTTLLYEGQSILLEGFVVLFQLLSIYYILKRDVKINYFLSGACLALSFFMKQYGLFLLPALLVYILFAHISIKEKLLNASFLFLGFITIVILFVFFFLFKGVSVQDLMNSLFGKNYGGKSFATFINGVLGMVARHGVILLFIPLLIIPIRSIVSDKKFLLILVALAASFTPFFFKFFGHYYLHVIPFLFLLVLYILNVFYREQDKLPRYTLILFVSILYFFALSFGKNVKENILGINGELKSWQYSVAKEISGVIDTRENVLSHDSSIWPYLCDWKPIDPHKGGLIFPGFTYDHSDKHATTFFSKDEYFSLVRNAPYVVISYNGSYQYLQQNNLLEGHEKIKNIDHIQIWKRKDH